MNPSSESRDVRTFLGRLAPPLAQFLEVRTIVPDARPSQFFCTTVDEVLAIAERHSGKANVYVGACPRFRRGGRKDDVNTVVAFWADLDFHQIHRERNEAKAIALERIYSFPIPPSMIVLTGNGIQVWWMLDVAIPVGGDWSLDRLEGVNRGIAEKLGGDCVQDLSRVLRVPGTVNLPNEYKRARGCAPVPTQLLLPDGPTHQVDRFSSVAVLASHRSSPCAGTVVPVAPSDRPTDEVVEAFERLLERLGHAHPLVQTWRGARTLNDSSRSGWDMALVNQLFKVGIREEFVPQILSAFRHGRGVFARPDYVDRTIAKARATHRSKHGHPRSA